MNRRHFLTATTATTAMTTARAGLQNAEEPNPTASATNPSGLDLYRLLSTGDKSPLTGERFVRIKIMNPE